MAKKTPQLINLTPDEWHHLPRARAGFEPLVEPLVELYRTNEDTMRIVGFDPDRVLDALLQLKVLAPLEASLREQLELVVKTRALHESTCWQGTLQIYDRGKSAGHSNVDIARGVSPFREFMKTGPRKK